MEELCLRTLSVKVRRMDGAMGLCGHLAAESGPFGDGILPSTEGGYAAGGRLIYLRGDEQGHRIDPRRSE